MSHSLVVEICGYEFDAYADYEFERGCKGSRDEYGAPIEPDTYDQVNITHIYMDFENTGKFREIDLPSVVITEFEQEILEELKA